MERIFPEKLKAGDEIRVISPSSSLLRTGTFQDKLLAKERIEALGFKVSFSEHILENDLLESSSIQSRLADFHAAFSDKNVKAILCTIGGFNSNELLPFIDWKIVKDNPKIFCGFSDITVLHQAIFAHTGLVTYYGPGYIAFLMNDLQEFQTKQWLKAVSADNSSCRLNEVSEIANQGEDKAEDSYFLQASDFFTSDEWYLPEKPRHFLKNEWKIYSAGTAHGISFGGNLNTMMLVTGTSSQVRLRKPVAFLENAEQEDFYDWDRELAHFLQLYPDLSALVIGRFPKEAQMTDEILRFILDKHPRLQDIPVIYDVDFGHTQPIFTFPLGADVEISTAPLSIQILKG
ncbi:S66 peptidase family protein [Lactococcus sp.]|uniref:S66 family peptidase n=1 Tax=Lactococcus sp. TaxID=44273 RepID=UPI0035AE85DA